VRGLICASLPSPGERPRFNRADGLDKPRSASINGLRTSAFVADPCDGRRIMKTIKDPALSLVRFASSVDQAANRKLELV
jgi:hypothetical protein